MSLVGVASLISLLSGGAWWWLRFHEKRTRPWRRRVDDEFEPNSKAKPPRRRPVYWELDRERFR